MPTHFAVINADPGMENSLTYKYNSMIRGLCEESGIRYIKAAGPNLYNDLVSLTPETPRVDNPPYWVINDKGKIGRLMQGCTNHYKVAPMDREIRKLLYEIHGISIKSRRIPGVVVKWIGFTAEESQRKSEPDQKYVRFEYPLIEKGIYKKDVHAFYKKNGIELPPRSVCNGCFANGLETFKEMRDNRPGDFQQAVDVDESIRHNIPGVKGDCYVSRTCIPLKQLDAQDFKLSPDQIDRLKNRLQPDGETLHAIGLRGSNPEGDQDEFSCDKGVCFV